MGFVKQFLQCVAKPPGPPRPVMLSSRHPLDGWNRCLRVKESLCVAGETPTRN